jgi:hypothetical protein
MTRPPCSGECDGPLNEVPRDRIEREKVREEQCGFFHQRIAAIFQKHGVFGEEVMLPQVQAEPGSTSRPDAVIAAIDRRGATPQIGVVVDHPPSCAVMRAGGARPGLGTICDEIEERLSAIRKIRDLGLASSSPAG